MMAKSNDKQILLLIILLIISCVSAISQTNSTVLNYSSNKLKHLVKNVEPQPRGHEQWGYLDGHYGHDVGAYGKSDYYWLIPLVIVIGFGALLLPLLGTLMTTMITTGTINLTAGRKRRDLYNERLQAPHKGIPQYIAELLSKVEEAFDKFGNEIKSDVSPLLSQLNTNKL